MVNDPDGAPLVMDDGGTDPRYGADPKERTIEELMDRGVVILDKPSGPTSHQVVHWLKNILGIEKAGHHGTLDPRTTGVLPVALGKGVRALNVTEKDRKEYVALMKLHREVEEGILGSVSEEFKGEIYQMVPVRSAVKRGLRTRRVHYLKILEVRGGEVLLLVGCDPGTYIRTLVHDMGEVIGVGANMVELRRTRSGGIKENDCVTLQQVKDAHEIFLREGEEGPLRKVVRPYEVLFEHLHRVVIKDSAVDAVCHGAPLGIPGLASVSSTMNPGDDVVVLTRKGEAVALGEALLSSARLNRRGSGRAVEISRVLMDPGTYPRAWKRKE